MRVARTKASKIREGDQVVFTVARVLGVQGRKPTGGAPLMKLEFEDGTVEVLREDEIVQVIRPT
jgi:hypothetical protein